MAQYLTDARHYRHLPFSWLLFSCGAFPVSPGTADTRAIRHAREQLLAGELLVIFPEAGPAGGGLEFLDGAGHLGLTPGSPSYRRRSGASTASCAVGVRSAAAPCSWPSATRSRCRRPARGASAPSSPAGRAAIGELLEPMMRAYP